MGEQLTFRYDREGDILYVDTTLPYAEQESDELGDDVIARFNPTTGAIVNLEVLFFSKRLQSGAPFSLPVSAHLRATAEV